MGDFKGPGEWRKQAVAAREKALKAEQKTKPAPKDEKKS